MFDSRKFGAAFHIEIPRVALKSDDALEYCYLTEEKDALWRIFRRRVCGPGSSILFASVHISYMETDKINRGSV